MRILGRYLSVTLIVATLAGIRFQYFKQGNQHNVNAYHNAELDGVFMFESYITDAERGGHRRRFRCGAG